MKISVLDVSEITVVNGGCSCTCRERPPPCQSQFCASSASLLSLGQYVNEGQCRDACNTRGWQYDSCV